MLWGVRVATDARVGGGHLARCSALSQALNTRAMLFTDPDYKGGRGSEWASMAVAEASMASAGCAIAALRSGDIDVLIVDSYAIGDDVIREAAANGAVAVFRDGTPYGAETITIDPNPGRADSKSVLGGPSYMPLPAEFVQRNLQGRAHKMPNRPLSVLVAFGARDSANRTIMALEGSEGLGGRLTVSVALGSGAPNAESVLARLRNMPFAGILDDRAALADRYNSFDVAIGAPGVSQFERACCGLASLLVPQNEKQIRLADAWQQTGAAVCSAPDSGAVAKQLTMLLDKPDRIEDMRRCGLSLVDGQGAARLAGALKQRLAA